MAENPPIDPEIEGDASCVAPRCPRCGGATRPEHAHNRCDNCGYVVPCCEPDGGG